MSLFCISPTAAAVTAPAGALSVFLHCCSSDCSRRSPVYIYPLPRQCLLPQELFLYFPTAAAVTAPSWALSVFPQCHSSVCSRRSPLYISPLLKQCLLPQEPFQFFPTAAAVPPSAEATFFRSLYLSRSYRQGGVCSHRSQTLFSKATAVPLLQAMSSTPPTLSSANFGGLSLRLSGCCPALISYFVGERRLGTNYRTRSPLAGQHAKYAYPLLLLLYRCISIN